MKSETKSDVNNRTTISAKLIKEQENLPQGLPWDIQHLSLHFFSCLNYGVDVPFSLKTPKPR